MQWDEINNDQLHITKNVLFTVRVNCFNCHFNSCFSFCKVLLSRCTLVTNEQHFGLRPFAKINIDNLSWFVIGHQRVSFILFS